MTTIDFELDSNLDWLECSVSQVELPTTKNKTHSTNKKFTWSAEVVEKIRTARAQQIISDETKKKISDALKGRPSKNLGKIRSEEIRKKLSEVHRGRIHSDETRKKMSDSAQKRVRIFVTPLGTFAGKAELKTAGLRYETILTRMKKNPEEYYYGN